MVERHYITAEGIRAANQAGHALMAEVRAERDRREQEKEQLRARLDEPLDINIEELGYDGP